MAKSKSTLAITRDQFRSDAKPLPVVINGKELVAMAKEFSTGSLGWNINDKLQVEVGGHIVTVQVGLNLTIIGSKDLPGSPVAATAASPPPPATATGDVSTGGGQADF